MVGDLPATEGARVRLASRPDTPAATLHALAQDPGVVVRAALAMNPTCCAHLDQSLARDADERVRILLAERLASLLPDLPEQERSRTLSHACQTLLTLARDAASRVRTVMSDALASMPEAPYEVILALARDEHESVSVPVLRLSPLLTDADLLEILASPPHPAAARAVASRSELGESLADAIAARADAASVRVLLQNQSAMIRETTLDALIGRAGNHPEWHEPLVQRPWLAEQASRALSVIVTGQLLRVLLDRQDMPPGLAEELRNKLHAGLAPESDSEGMARLARLHGRTIGEPAFLHAASRADRSTTRLLLALASRTSLEHIDRAVARRSAKALVSLVWRAGYAMAAAKLAQSVLGALAPAETLEAALHGAFPLSIREMEWQIEQLARPDP